MPRHVSIRTFCVLSAITCILGVLMIGNSFAINTGPPLNATNAQYIWFAQQHAHDVLKGAWLQAVGTFFILLFAVALVHLSRSSHTFGGWMTFLGATTLLFVSLMEVVCYIMALFPTPETMGAIGNNIGHAVQHLYFIVAAPALFLPLGFVILFSKVLPGVFGYLALLLACAFFAVGIYSLYRLILTSLDTSLAAIQALWWFAAAVVLIFRSRKIQQMFPQ
ncbi:hypothetical protein BXY57_2079 [Thermoflavifilum aggregans]|uniref:DUF4386 domain-containing protein n=1 Tax=Thermoflavifilum aggregans TaxID=454188 RepID=A0A2M9CX50_9BACT|nr:hypothetical protein [Thermoflavifilum aggregans]PJJ76459.1 hypothetical protein BXY57_2079 [Thermoflavifilum aggregans]